MATDAVSTRAADLIRALLDADAEVRFVASGTAANALTLAALAAPHEAVLCHEHAHIATDETGAPGFFGSGVGLITAARRLRPDRAGGAGRAPWPSRTSRTTSRPPPSR